ncbi:MAG: zf-HC2 domain-containing protein [Proteobacteria bacterium]|nr:zf-HC2 domain-containing protein [Pseudomonadota bacterium]
MKKHYSEKQLMAFVDDALGETEYNLIKSHLKTCSQCAGHVESLQSIFKALDRWESPPVENELAGNTMKLWKLIQQNNDQQKENYLNSGLKKTQRYLAIAAMAAGLAIGILFGDIARRGIIGIESSDHFYPVVLQENGESINDNYVSLIISEGRDDL